MRLERVSVIQLKCLNYPFGNSFNTKYILSSLIAVAFSGYRDVGPGLRSVDQIWRNFAIMAKFSKSWANFEGLFTIWENFGPTLAKLCKPLGKFSLSEC